MEGARSISEAADGVAVWKMGRLMLSGSFGLPDTPGTLGKVEDLGRSPPAPLLLAPPPPPTDDGRVDVLRLGMVTVSVTPPPGLSSATVDFASSVVLLQSLMSILRLVLSGEKALLSPLPPPPPLLLSLPPKVALCGSWKEGRCLIIHIFPFSELVAIGFSTTVVAAAFVDSLLSKGHCFVPLLSAWSRWRSGSEVDRGRVVL